MSSGRLPDERRRVRVVVIGAGIAGLAAAHELLVRRPDLQVEVLERSSRVGGKLLLGQVAGLDVDLGAESMLARRPEALDLARSVGIGDAIVHPSTSAAGLWTHGEVRPMPPTLMGVPADVRIAARTGVLGRVGAARARLESRMPSPDLTKDVSIGSLVARRLGREVRDRLVDPLLGGVYAGRCDDLSAHAAWPQVVAAVRRHGGLLAAAAAETSAARRSGTRQPAGSPVFAGIAGGVGKLADATAEAIGRLGGRVRCDVVVRDLVRTEHGWRLVVGSAASAQQVEADAVVIAVPAAPASRLLGAVVPKAARELAHVEYASLALVTVAVRARDVDVELTGSGFLVPPVDATTIKAATYSSRKWSWLARAAEKDTAEPTVILRCSIGRHGDEAVLQQDDTELVEAAMLDLRDATGLRAPLVDATVARWGGALPQYAVGHLDRVLRIRADVATMPGLAVCGAALDGVGIPAVIASGQAAATQVLGRLSVAGTMQS